MYELVLHEWGMTPAQFDSFTYRQQRLLLARLSERRKAESGGGSGATPKRRV